MHSPCCPRCKSQFREAGSNSANLTVHDTGASDTSNNNIIYLKHLVSIFNRHPLIHLACLRNHVTVYYGRQYGMWQLQPLTSSVLLLMQGFSGEVHLLWRKCTLKSCDKQRLLSRDNHQTLHPNLSSWKTTESAAAQVRRLISPTIAQSIS
jgi:hypothetical protein